MCTSEQKVVRLKNSINKLWKFDEAQCSYTYYFLGGGK